MEINRETENAGSQRVALAALPDQTPVMGLEDSKAEAGSFATNNSGSGNSGMDGESPDTEWGQQVLNWAEALRWVEEAVQGGPPPLLTYREEMQLAGVFEPYFGNSHSLGTF